MVTLHFRYRGTFDFKRLYKEGRGFFTSRGFKFNEKKVKYKSDEFEGVWAVEHRYDAYHMFKYDVEWHCYDMSPTTMKTPEGKEVPAFTGKIWVRFEGDFETNYKHETPAGSIAIFDSEDSWLHKVYKRITYRDRDDVYEADLVITAHQFIDLMKQITNVDAK